MHLQPPEWWTRLGGPSAVTLTAWLFLLPGAILVTYILTPPGGIDERWPQWLVVGLASHGAMGLVLLAFGRTVLAPGDRPSRPLLTLMAAGLSGVARGVTVGLLSVAMGLALEPLIAQRSVITAVSMLVWWPLATLGVDGVRRHRATMARLQGTVDRERLLASRIADGARERRTSLVDHALDVVVTQLEKAAHIGAGPEAAAERLREIATQVVRPLGHELAQRTEGEDRLLDDVDRAVDAATVPFSAYLVGLVSGRAFRARLAASLLGLSSLLTVIHSFGLVLGLATVVLVMAVVLVLAAGAGRFLVPRLVGCALPVRVIIVAATMCAISLAAGIAAMEVPGAAEYLAAETGVSTERAQIATLVVYSAITLGVLASVALVGAITEMWERAEGDLAAAVRAAEWTAARLRQLAWSDRQALGRLVHGTIQARLVSTALQIQLNPPPDPAQAIEALGEEIRATLDRHGEPPWNEALADLQDVWQEAITLDIHVADACTAALATDEVAAHALAETLREAVQNAVRHGGASRVSATVSPANGHLAVLVGDDGRPGPVGPPGFGSHLLDGACVSWSLSLEPPTTLRALVACGALRATEVSQP